MSCSSRWRVPERARRTAAAALVALLAFASTGLAANEDPTPPHLRKYFAGQVAGAARLTWFGLHVYDAKLFVPESFNAQDPSRDAFALELTYARSLAGRAIAETSRDEIARLGFGSESARQSWFEQMLRIFPDVERGRRIAGVNLPGRGVRFLVDGEERGGIDDTEFARAFFAIWLDPRTRSPRVREDLLRGLSSR